MHSTKRSSWPKIKINTWCWMNDELYKRTFDFSFSLKIGMKLRAMYSFRGEKEKYYIYIYTHMHTLFFISYHCKGSIAKTYGTINTLNYYWLVFMNLILRWQILSLNKTFFSFQNVKVLLTKMLTLSSCYTTELFSSL